MNDMLSQAVNHLKNGHVIAYPTEAVYGLGCDPFNEAAVKKLLQLKNRKVSKGLILIASDIAMLKPLIGEITQEQWQLLIESWPAALTWLVPKSELVPAWISGKHTSVALRVTAHPLAKALCEQFKGPIVSTSANPEAQDPARDAQTVINYFKDKVDFVLSGPVDQNAKPSTIKDLITGKVLRS